MSKYRFQVIPLPIVASATAMHKGTNSEFDPYAKGFIVQANGGAVHMGESTVTGETDGFTVLQGETINSVGMLSRGSNESYDLRQIYYVGGPFKLILEKIAK